MGWIKKFLSKLLLGKKVSGVIRHTLTTLGGVLVYRGLATPEVAEIVTSGIADSLITLVQSDEFWGGIMIAVGGGSSVAEKKKR